MAINSLPGDAPLGQHCSRFMLPMGEAIRLMSSRGMRKRGEGGVSRRPEGDTLHNVTPRSLSGRRYARFQRGGRRGRWVGKTTKERSKRKRSCTVRGVWAVMAGEESRPAVRATPLLRNWWAPGLQGRWGPVSPWYRPASLEVEVAEVGVKPGLVRGLSVVVVGTHEDDVVNAEACELHKGLEEGRMGVWVRLEEHRKVLLAVRHGGLVSLEYLQGTEEGRWGKDGSDLDEACLMFLRELWCALGVLLQVLEKGVEEGMTLAAP